MHGKPLVYLDNAATTQKPQQVIRTIVDYYQQSNANVHRGNHYLAGVTTTAIEEVRKKVQRFIHAQESAEIIFTSGATAALNLVATAHGEAHVQAGDAVLVSATAHHANFLPWQRLCQEKHADLHVIPADPEGRLDLVAFKELLTPRTKIVALAYVVGALGTVHPLKTLIQQAHNSGAVVVVDATQAAPHLPLDVQALDSDFLTFSGHKAYGPTGVGVLHGKRQWLMQMPPYQLGGGMVKDVQNGRVIHEDIPYKFEPGTPNIAGILGLGSALDFLFSVGMDKVHVYEKMLLRYIDEQLAQVKDLRRLGISAERVGITSFVIEQKHHLDIGLMLDAEGIAIRTGHHCSQPLMDHLDLEGTVRASLALYNTKQDIDRLVEALLRISKRL